MKNQLPFLPYLFSIILSIGLVAVFLQLSAVLSRIEFESGRIDNLEKRPVSLVDQLVESDNKPSPSPIVSTKTTAQVVATASTLTSQSPKPTTTPTPSTLGTKLLTYLPIYGSHTTIDSAWSDVPGSEFVISSQELGSASLYFEAIASVEAGSGEARIRIYDTKNNIVVNGSEIVTTSSTPSLVRSGRLSMWSGENTYKLQLSSKVPTPARFYFGRIKIVYN